MSPNPSNARATQIKKSGCYITAIVGVLVLCAPNFATAADARSGSQSTIAARADRTQIVHHRASSVDRRRSRVALSSTPTVLRGTRPATATTLQPTIPVVMQPTGPGMALGTGYGSSVNPAGDVPEGGWGGLDLSGLNPPAGGVILGR